VPTFKIMVNLNYLKEISGGDQQFIKDMLLMFNQTTAKEVRGFNQLLLEENYAAIGSLAHKIKAPVQMICHSDLTEQVKQLEKLGKEARQLDQIPSLIQLIQSQMELLAVEIDKTLQTIE
jgi:HPt (histidine-containing phosphotransfer) domain-containing protein